MFGRSGMGETVEEGALTDRWRVRRGGKLVYAESLRLDGSRWGIAELGPDWTSVGNDSTPPSSPVTDPTSSATSPSQSGRREL